VLKKALYLLIALHWLRRILRRSTSVLRRVGQKDSASSWGPAEEPKNYAIYVTPYSDMRLETYRYGNHIKISDLNVGYIAAALAETEAAKKFLKLTKGQYEICLLWSDPKYFVEKDLNINELLCKYEPPVAEELLSLLREATDLVKRELKPL
jgi:hypothetical protein